MSPTSAALFQMVVCVPLMFVVIGIFVVLTKMLTKIFPAK